MRILIYKRTHNTDPKDKCFGSHDCMGRVRNLPFDAVIGIGANSLWARECGIDGKVSWIGIGAKKSSAPAGYRGPYVTFDHFVHFEQDGPPLVVIAPQIANRFYRRHPARYLFDSFSEIEQAELDQIIRLAKRAKASHSGSTHIEKRRKVTKCKPVC